MGAHLQFKLLLVITIIIAYGQLAKADTKVLRNIRLITQRSSRDETISLENDKELVVKGLLEQKFFIPDDPGHILKATIDYVADKNGYRAKYTLVKEEFVEVLRLNPGTLKTLGG